MTGSTCLWVLVGFFLSFSPEIPTVIKQILREDSDTIYLCQSAEGNKICFNIGVRNYVEKTISKTSLRMQHLILTQK